MTSTIRGVTRKPILVLVNPTSGTKLANQMMKTILKPELDKRNIEFELISSQYAGHVTEFVSKCNLEHYSGIITISGDGLIHEVFNGLYARSDWDTMGCQMPLGVIPGGSGNALNCSILRQLGQPIDGLKGLGAERAALHVAEGAEKNSTISLDLVEVEHFTGKKFISFLGASIGLIADVDIGSEHLRFLGYIRSYLYVAYRIMFPVAYDARVSYLPLKKGADGQPIGITPADKPLVLPPLSEPVPSNWMVEENKYYCLYAVNLSLLDPITLFAPDSKLDDGVLWLVKIAEEMNRWEMINWLLNSKDAYHVRLPGVELIPIRAFRIEPFRPQGYMSIDAESLPFGPFQGQILGQKGKLISG